MPEDKRLDRLLDYTKFHIGIYLATAAGIFTAAAPHASDSPAFALALKSLFHHPWGLVAAGVCMVIAGMSGGVIASSCTQHETFPDFWDRPQGPLMFKWFHGRTWTMIEHSSFWIGAGLLAFSLLAR